MGDSAIVVSNQVQSREILEQDKDSERVEYLYIAPPEDISLQKLGVDSRVIQIVNEEHNL